MELLARNDSSRDTLGDILDKNNIKYTVDELGRDLYNSAVFLYKYERDGMPRIALELMQMAAMDDPWFMSFIWQLNHPNEQYNVQDLWKFMKSEIEEKRRK